MVKQNISNPTLNAIHGAIDRFNNEQTGANALAIYNLIKDFTVYFKVDSIFNDYFKGEVITSEFASNNTFVKAIEKVYPDGFECLEVHSSKDYLISHSVEPNLIRSTKFTNLLKDFVEVNSPEVKIYGVVIPTSAMYGLLIYSEVMEVLYKCSLGEVKPTDEFTLVGWEESNYESDSEDEDLEYNDPTCKGCVDLSNYESYASKESSIIDVHNAFIKLTKDSSSDNVSKFYLMLRDKEVYIPLDPIVKVKYNVTKLTSDLLLKESVLNYSYTIGEDEDRTLIGCFLTKAQAEQDSPDGSIICSVKFCDLVPAVLQQFGEMSEVNGLLLDPFMNQFSIFLSVNNLNCFYYIESNVFGKDPKYLLTKED